MENNVLLKEDGAKLWKSIGWKISSWWIRNCPQHRARDRILEFSKPCNTVWSGTASLPAGVMESLQSSEVPPCWRKALLQVLATALTRSLEELDVAPQPGHEGTNYNIRHLGELVMQERCGCMISDLLKCLIVGLWPDVKLSVLRVYVLMITSDNRAVNKKAPHYHNGF